MKKIILATLLGIFGISSVFAQQQNESDSHIIYINVPQNMKIKDKIFLVNKSPYTVLQSGLVFADDNKTLGTTLYINPGCTAEMASYDDNWLKNVRGKKIALKVKAAKKVFGDQSATGVAGGSFVTGGFGVGVTHSEMKADEINNIDPSLITYDFHATICEQDHDLYITITAGSASSALDF